MTCYFPWLCIQFPYLLLYRRVRAWLVIISHDCALNCNIYYCALSFLYNNDDTKMRDFKWYHWCHAWLFIPMVPNDGLHYWTLSYGVGSGLIHTYIELICIFILIGCENCILISLINFHKINTTKIFPIWKIDSS